MTLTYATEFLSAKNSLSKTGLLHYHAYLFQFPLEKIEKYFHRVGKHYRNVKVPIISRSWQKGLLENYERIANYNIGSHQKGGDDYADYAKIKTPEDYPYKTKLEYRNIRGQLRPFHRQV